MITNRTVVVVVACGIAAGCGGGNQSISAPRTVPVSGSVLVKGKAAAGVTVKFHPQFDMGAVTFTPNAETRKDGHFTLATAAGGAGAPPGDYAVTFELLRAATDKNGQDTDVDVWKGKYAEPAKSAWKVTVKDGENALEPFKLD